MAFRCAWNAARPSACWGRTGPGRPPSSRCCWPWCIPPRALARLFGNDARRPSSRRPAGYLPENHRFPTYMTGAGMLDFYAALSGMEPRERKQRIAGAARAGRPRRLGRRAAQEVLQGHAAAPWPGAGADAFSIAAHPGRTVGRRRSGGPPRDPRDPALARRARASPSSSTRTCWWRWSCSAARWRSCSRGKVALHGEGEGPDGRQGLPALGVGVSERLAETLRPAAGRLCRQGRPLRVPVREPRRGQRRPSICCAPERCEIEEIARTTSTLEDVFMRTVNA